MGSLKETIQATTLADINEVIVKKLEDRNVHPDIINICKEELVAENYFHSILEVFKGITKKIRAKTGLTQDGVKLMQKAFSQSSGAPFWPLNSFVTISDKNEQAGFCDIMKGLFEMFRNPHAHDPKVERRIEEQDFLDLLSFLSLIHRKLDAAI